MFLLVGCQMESKKSVETNYFFSTGECIFFGVDIYGDDGVVGGWVGGGDRFNVTRVTPKITRSLLDTNPRSFSNLTLINFIVIHGARSYI